MGHLASKDIFRRAGRKIDSLAVRAPWNDALYRIVRELFSEEEAEIFVAMPWVLSPVGRIAACLGRAEAQLAPLLERMADKGLLLDLHLNDAWHYAPNPLFIGLFEFPMMRTGPDADTESLAHLFRAYLGDGTPFLANTRHGERVSPLRVLPWEEALGDHVEVLDYEKASAVVREAKSFAVGICSCRHEKHHTGERGCSGPLNLCTTMGMAADYLVRHDMGTPITRDEMLDRLAESRDSGRVLSADNVQRNVTFICHCCRCCCNVLQGISRFGCTNLVVTSSYLAHSDGDACTGCGTCADSCPIEAVTMVDGPAGAGDGQRPQVDDTSCIGCGVCGVACPSGAMRLLERGQRVLHPETTFRRIVLQCLEHGTLQNQLFDNPASRTQEGLRLIVGAFLALPPVKRALMSEALRSRFLAGMEAGVRMQGMGELVEL